MGSKSGKTIKGLRKAKGMTARELGERVGVSQQRISKYERGETGIQPDMLMKIAAALEVPVELLADIGDLMNAEGLRTADAPQKSEPPDPDAESMTVERLFAAAFEASPDKADYERKMSFIELWRAANQFSPGMGDVIIRFVFVYSLLNEDGRALAMKQIENLKAYASLRNPRFQSAIPPAALVRDEKTD